MGGMRRGLVCATAFGAAWIALLAASIQPANAAPAQAQVCPRFPCWVLNAEAVWSVERHSDKGPGRTEARFANRSTYPILQSDKVPPNSPDWDFYTTPPQHVLDGGAHRSQQYWNFQSLWMSCPPAGTPRRPHQYVPPPDVYAFFLDLEIGRGSQEDVNQFDPLVRTYQAWVQTNLGFTIGTDGSIESHEPREFMAAVTAY